MMGTRNLAEEAKVNGRVRRRSWRSQDSIEVGGIKLDVNVWRKCRWNGVDIWTRKKVC